MGRTFRPYTMAGGLFPIYSREVDPVDAEQQAVNQRIERIKARLAAASEGPWDTDCHFHHAQGCRCMSDYDPPTGWYLETGSTLCCDEVVAQKNSDENGWEAKNDFGRPFTSCEDGPFISYEDAEFAAHAREDVPWLLDLVGRLMGK